MCTHRHTIPYSSTSPPINPHSISPGTQSAGCSFINRDKLETHTGMSVKCGISWVVAGDPTLYSTPKEVGGGWSLQRPCRVKQHLWCSWKHFLKLYPGPLLGCRNHNGLLKWLGVITTLSHFLGTTRIRGYTRPCPDLRGPEIRVGTSASPRGPHVTHQHRWGVELWTWDLQSFVVGLGVAFFLSENRKPYQDIGVSWEVWPDTHILLRTRFWEYSRGPNIVSLDSATSQMLYGSNQTEDLRKEGLIFLKVDTMCSLSSLI